jgi:hypothetical protein
MNRSLRVLFAVVLTTVPLGLATSATAQTCPLLDPTCRVDQVIDDGQGVVDDTLGHTGNGTVDGAHDSVQDAVDASQGTAGDTVSTVRDTIDKTIGNIDDPLPGGGPGGGNGGGGNGGGGGHGSGHHTGNATGAHDNGMGVGANVSASAGGSIPAGTTVPGSAGLPPTDPSSRDRGSAPTIAQVAAGVSTGIAMMALLLGAVATFLSVQDRVDRRDPKLVAAAIGSDRVLFT